MCVYELFFVLEEQVECTVIILSKREKPGLTKSMCIILVYTV